MSDIKLVIQIPCFNEEDTLPATVADLPRAVPGVDVVEWLVVDDGSSDRTVEVARQLGVDHVVRHTTNRGLAAAFTTGLDAALRAGADIVVNTDADNQYDGSCIADLIRPILDGGADLVVGERPIEQISEFSGLKKRLQRLGSWVVRRFSGTAVRDAASGFRAYSASSLMRLNIVTDFSYCMETIIQAGHKRMAIASIPVVTNEKTRESRLFKNIWQHMGKSASAIMRSFIMFKPHAFFGLVGTVLLLLGLIPFVRFLVLVAMGDGGGHVQSLIFGTALVVGALFSFALLVIADLQRTNRVLMEETLEQLRILRFGDRDRDRIDAADPPHDRTGSTP